MAALQGYERQTLGSTIDSGGNRAATAPIEAMARGSLTLTQKLEEMSNRMYKNRATNAKVKAGEDALIDVAKYKSEIIKIRDKYSGSPELMNKKIAEANSSRFADATTIYGAAYKDKFSAAYSDEITLDVIEKSALAEIAAQGNANTYATAMNSYALEMTENAPSTELARFARMSYEKAGIQGFKKLSLAGKTVDRAAMKKSNEDVLSHLETEYITAYGNQDESGMIDSMAQFSAGINSAVSAGYMTENAGNVRIITAQQDATIAKFNTDFQATIAGNGDVAMEIQKIYRSEEFKALPQKKKSDFMDSMFSDMSADDARDRQFKADLDAEEEEAQEELYQETLADIYSGAGSLKDINDKETAGELSKADASSLRTVLSQGSRAESDLKTITWYTHNNNLANTSELDIYNDNSLSWPDKTKLIKDRKSLLTTKEFKWTTTQNGKEARARIKRHFGFREGALIVNLDNATEKAYNDIMINMFDHIGSLPEAEQGSLAIPYANELISGYEQGLKDKADSQEAKRAEKRKKQADESWKEYGTGFTSMFNSLTESEYREEFYESKKWKAPTGGF